VDIFQINSCSGRISGRVCLGGLGDAYRTSPNGKPRIVKVMMGMANTGSSMIHCFDLQYCIWDVYLTVSPYYLYSSIAMNLSVLITLDV
jgi:hypothetical protein